MGLTDIREVIPNSPFVKSRDIFNYNKCSVDPGALESNPIVIFSISRITAIQVS